VADSKFRCNTAYTGGSTYWILPAPPVTFFTALSTLLFAGEVARTLKQYIAKKILF
jgi:hypothetical protein